MILVTVEDLRKHFGPEPVLDGVTFDVHSGQRIGLAGPNGTGKTTLLRIMAGRDEHDGGSCVWHPSARWGYLEQQPMFESGRTLWDEAHSALDEWVLMQQEAETVAKALGQTPDEAEHKRLADRYDYLQHELHRHGAYNLEYKTERVLDGLRFPRNTFQQPVESLSGGEQNRLMLAKLLLAEPDLMLLDEPSNHLDMEATEWLETFLTGSDAGMIVVSHDRYFLDRVTNRTLELFRGTVDSYVGNFSAYWQQKAERLLVQRRTYERREEEIAKTEDFIRRNAYGMKHAQAEDRRKKLARIERIEPPREIAMPPMRFAEARRSGDFVLRVERLAKRFDRPLFSDVSCDILRHQRFALLGPNGSGKTTLLKCLVGVIEPDEGQVSVGTGVEIGYFDQQLTGLDPDTLVVDAIRPGGKEFLTQQRRDLLALFGITGDTQLQKVGQLSGGEQCRAALARLAAADANFLVLDEPTNHLDLWAREALEQALRNFEGTVLFVSHDRYFVDQVADHLLVIEKERVRVFEGNYSEYQRFLAGRGDAQEEAPARPPPKPSPAKGGSRPAEKTAKPGTRKRTFPYRKATDIEAEIAQRELRVKELHELMARPETHRSRDRVREVKTELDENNEKLRILYQHWEEAVELNG